MDNMLRKLLDDLKEALKTQLKDQDADYKSKLGIIKDGLDEEGIDKDTEDDHLARALKKLQKDVEPYNDQLKDIEHSIRELVNTVDPRLEEHKRSLDKSDGERQARHTTLEQQILELVKKVEEEIAARSALQADLEQAFDTLRTKLRVELQEATDALHVRTDALGNRLRGELDEEKHARGAGDDKNDQAFNERKIEADKQATEVSDNVKGFEKRMRDELIDLERRMEERIFSEMEVMHQQYSLLLEATVALLNEEDSTNYRLISYEQEALIILDNLWQDVGEHFLRKYRHPRRQMVTARRACKGMLKTLSGFTRMKVSEETPRGE